MVVALPAAPSRNPDTSEFALPLWREGPMVLTKQELIALLQKEVRLLLHLTTMGPGLVRYTKGQPMDAVATPSFLKT